MIRTNKQMNEWMNEMNHFPNYRGNVEFSQIPPGSSPSRSWSSNCSLFSRPPPKRLWNSPLMSSLMEPNDEKTGGNFTKNQIICHVNSDESRWWLRSRCAAAAAEAACSSSSFLKSSRRSCCSSTNLVVEQVKLEEKSEMFHSIFTLTARSNNHSSCSSSSPMFIEQDLRLEVQFCRHILWYSTGWLGRGVEHLQKKKKKKRKAATCLWFDLEVVSPSSCWTLSAGVNFCVQTFWRNRNFSRNTHRTHTHSFYHSKKVKPIVGLRARAARAGCDVPLLVNAPPLFTSNVLISLCPQI